MNESTNGGATPLRCVEGLCVAIVKNKDGIDTAVSQLAEEMDSEGAHTGVLLVGSEFARSFFGPVPQEWISRGISLVVGRSDNLVAESDALFNEYRIGLAAADANLRRLGEFARRRLQPTASKEPVESRLSENGPSEQQANRRKREPVGTPERRMQQSATGSRSDFRQGYASAGSLGAGANVAGALGSSFQEGSVQGGSIQRGGESDTGPAAGSGAGASGGEARGARWQPGET